VVTDIDRVVGADASVDVREFLDAGQVPADWMCQHLRHARARRRLTPEDLPR